MAKIPKLKRRPPKHTIDEVAAALTMAGGVRRDAASVLGCSIRTLYRYLERHEELRDVAAEVDHDLVELAEDALFNVLKDPDAKGHLTAVIFTLKCRGKHRGWIDKQVVEHTGTVEHGHTVGLEAMPDDRLDALVDQVLRGAPRRPLLPPPAEAK